MLISSISKLSIPPFYPGAAKVHCIHQVYKVKRGKLILNKDVGAVQKCWVGKNAFDGGVN